MTMQCDMCGSDCEEIVGILTETDSFIGEYSVPQARYYRCVACGAVFYPLATSRMLDQKRKEVEHASIRRYSIADFMSGSETADYLKISRQALHKHRRVRKGFIYATRFGGKTVYLRRSVELFKQRGDGRFPFLRSSLYVETLPHFTAISRPSVTAFWRREACCSPQIVAGQRSTTDTVQTALFLRPESPGSEYPRISGSAVAMVREGKDVKYA